MAQKLLTQLTNRARHKFWRENRANCAQFLSWFRIMVTLTRPNIRTGPKLWKNGSWTGKWITVRTIEKYGPQPWSTGGLIRGYLAKDSKIWVDSTVEIFPNLMKNMKSLRTWIRFILNFPGKRSCNENDRPRFIDRLSRKIVVHIWTLIKALDGKNCLKFSFRINPYDFLFDLTFYIFDKA